MTDVLNDDEDDYSDDVIEVEMVDEDEFQMHNQDIEGLLFERNKVLQDDLAPTRLTFK